MTGIWSDLKDFGKKRAYVICLVLTMALSYATLLHQPTVGIDDTSFGIYYEDGVSPAMGRWCLFLINKIFPLGYNPYFVEAVGLLLFCVSVTLWCIVFRRMFGAAVSEWGYVVFSCVMVSSPILSEVVVWYVQDGIYLGYGMTALAVLASMEAFRGGAGRDWKKRLKWLAAGAGLLTVALGFYEAFMIVYLMGMVMNFFLIRALKKDGYSGKPGEWAVNIPALGVGAIALRTVIVRLMILAFHLQDQEKVLKSRGIYEVLGWFDGTRSPADFVYMLKEFFVKYYINAVVYVPVMIFVLAVLAVLGFSVYFTVRNKDGWILAAAVGMLLIPWMLPVLEGVATYYRSSQYIPVFTGFAVLLAAWAVNRRGMKGAVRAAACFLALVLVYRQAYEMNRWLYVDALKYEDDRRTMDAVALYLMENCDITKPVCVIGERETPESLTAAAYCPGWSGKYRLVRSLVNVLDEDIFEAYDSPAGYAFAETPRLSFVKWGATAFYGFDRELIKFWKMHGFTLVEDGNLSHYEEAELLFEDGPAWPRKGSVVEQEDHIIVNFG